MPDVTKPASAAVPTDPEGLRDLIDRAPAGDEETLPALQELLKSQRMVEAVGDLAAYAQNRLVDKVGGKNLVVREGLRKKLNLDGLRIDLGAGPPDSADGD